MRALFPKALVAFVALPIVAGLIGLLLVVSFSLPNKAIADNILEREATLLERRANNGRVIDADTECIGLSIGLYRSDDAPQTAWKRALLAESAYGCEPFVHWLKTSEMSHHRDYYRYWHGHALVSRPLLSVMPYNDARGAIFTACLLTFSWLLWRLGRTFSPKLALAFALPFLLLNALGYWVVVTKAVTWLLIMGGCLFFSRRSVADASPAGENSPPVLVFFTLGSLTAVFDFLTAPALIFCLPAMVWLLYDRESANARPKTLIMMLGVSGAFFLLGFAGLWLLKIVIAAIVFGPEVWADAGASVFNRLRGESDYVDGYWPGAALVENFGALKTIWGILTGLFLLAPLVRPSIRRALPSIIRASWPFIVLALAPLIWLELLSNHSQIHAAFTHLNFAPLLFLVGIVLFRQEQAIARAGAVSTP